MSLTTKLAEAWETIESTTDLRAIEDYFAPDYVRHGGHGDTDLRSFKELLAALHAGFPDLRTETADTVEAGDRVAYRWVSEGTHLGTYLGAPPTGRRVRATGITISRFENGRIVEDWASWNEVSVLHDLGILPIDRA